MVVTQVSSALKHKGQSKGVSTAGEVRGIVIPRTVENSSKLRGQMVDSFNNFRPQIYRYLQPGSTFPFFIQDFTSVCYSCQLFVQVPSWQMFRSVYFIAAVIFVCYFVFCKLKIAYQASIT